MMVGLAGCKTNGGETIGEAMVTDPGRYQLYGCRDLDDALTRLRRREVELYRLMQKASRSPDGELVSLIAYQPEYAQTRGYQKLVLREKQAKSCRVNSNK